MTGDRQKVLDAFAAHIAPYDAQDPKVSLKIHYTYRVAAPVSRFAALRWRALRWIPPGYAACCTMSAALNSCAVLAPLMTARALTTPAPGGSVRAGAYPGLPRR